MTTPFASASFPSNPTVPTSAPAGYTTPTTPPAPDVSPPIASEQLASMRGNLLELVLREVAQALLGAFVPGAESAFDQIAAWAANIPLLGPIVEALTGAIDGGLNELEAWATGIPSTVVDSVSLDPAKYFAEAMNVTGITHLWLSIEPWLNQFLGQAAVWDDIANFISGILGVTNNPTGAATGSLTHSTAEAVKTAVTPAVNAAANAVTAGAQAVGVALNTNPSTVTDAVSAAVSSVSPAAANIVSNLLAGPAAVVKSVADAADALAPAKGISGEIGSVAQNLMALVSNPSGSGDGSVVQQAANAVLNAAASATTTASDAAGAVASAAGSSLSTLLSQAGLTGTIATIANVVGEILTFLADPFGLFNLIGKILPTSGNHVVNDAIEWAATHLLGFLNMSVEDPLRHNSSATSTAAQALTDTAVAATEAPISTRFGTTSAASLISDMASLFTSSGGTGSLVQNLWQSVWHTINCNGWVGQGFSASHNATGVLDNPTGSSLGSFIQHLTSVATNLANGGGDELAKVVSTAQAAAGSAQNLANYVKDLTNTLFGANGAGLAQLTALANAAATGNLWALIGDIFNGTFGTLARVMSDITGIFGIVSPIAGTASGAVSWAVSAAQQVGSLVNFANSPTQPSPSGATTGASSAASSALSGLASLAGLGSSGHGGIPAIVTGFLSDFMGMLGNPNGLGTGLENLLLNAVDDIPVYGPMIASLIAGFTGDTGASTGVSTATGLSGAIGDVMSLLGSPSNLGTAGFNPKQALSGVVTQLNLAGAQTANTSVPVGTLHGITPSAGTNLLSDPNFTGGPGSLAGNGFWMWDQPGGTDAPGCVRTLRNGLITVFYVGGTYTGLTGAPAGGIQPIAGWNWPGIPPAVINENYPTPGANAGTFPGTQYVDPVHFEFVNIPYPGSVSILPGAKSMDRSIKDAVTYLAELINKTQGPFIISGISQGGTTVSDIYDEIRYGSLQHRRQDFLGGFTWGNPRKQQGQTFTDPTYGKWPDPAPSKSGMSLPNLGDCESLWNEFYDPDDICACCENDPNGANYERDKWIRNEFEIVSENFTSVIPLVLEGPSAWLAAFEAFWEIYDDIWTGETAGDISPHHRLWTTKPFGAQGDTRTNAQVMLDLINDFAHLVTPPYWNVPWTLEGQRFPAQAGTVITAGASCMWINVDVTADYDAIMVGVNAYDANGDLIQMVTSPDATITGPSGYQFSWLPIQGQFAMPEGTASAAIVFDVEPEVMTKGIVWFGAAIFEMNEIVDAAKLTNVGQIPTIGNTNVSGSQGIQTLDGTLSHTFDGLATAFNAGVQVINSDFAQLFTLAQKSSLDASNALSLAQRANQQLFGYFPPDEKSWSTAGSYVFDIPYWFSQGDLIDVIVLGPGGDSYRGGGASYGFPGGSSGKWTAVTLIYGTDVPTTTKTLNAVVGAGGSGVASTVSGAGMSNTITGAAGVDQGAPDYLGQGPGNEVWPPVPDPASQTYFGGATVGQAAPGSAPGGGGGGWPPGNWIGAVGGLGADGFVSITARRAPINDAIPTPTMIGTAEMPIPSVVSS